MTIQILDFKSIKSLTLTLYKKLLSLLKKWASDYCLTSNEQFYNYIMAKTSYIRWDNVRFVLDQHA